MKQFIYGNTIQFNWLRSQIQEALMTFTDAELPDSCTPNRCRVGFEYTQAAGFKLYIDRGILYAGTGAEVTARIVTQWLAECFDEAVAKPLDVFLIVHSEILDALRKTADDLACELGDLSCTLVAIAVDNAGRYVYWHLGDGGIITRIGNEIKVLSIPKKGEYANETFFITDNNAAVHLQFGVSTEEIQNATGFAVFSDRLLYDGTGFW